MNLGFGGHGGVGVAILNPLGSFELFKIQSCAMNLWDSLGVFTGMGCDTEGPPWQVLTGEQHLLLPKGLCKGALGGSPSPVTIM